jgi:predicted nucleotidyltransferase
MKRRQQVLKVLRDELPFLTDKYGVKKIGLFGSYSREEQTRKSDIDLLVEFERPIGFFKYIELEDYLAKRLGVKVELVTDEALKPALRPRLKKDIIYA